MLSRSNLHDYQRKAVDFIIERQRCALFLGLGLGKSTTSLTAASDLLDACIVNKVLVIGPLRVAQSVWKQEARNWEHLQHLRVEVATGTERNRIEALSRTADVYTINRENIPWLVNFYGKKWPFDMVIVDESSSFKNAGSQRFKAMKKILPLTDYMVLLTGTPSPNGLLDLWAQMYLIDKGESLGRTMTAYKQRFFESDFMGYNYTIRKGHDKIIHGLIEDKVLSMSAEDYLQMPDRIDLIEHVHLPHKVQAQYEELEKTLLTELETGDEVEALSAAALANKLLQFCNGCAYHGEEGEWAGLHDTKLDALQEIQERDPNENLLVAYNYKTDLIRLQERFPEAVVLDKDPKTIERWNGGEIKMLLAHPASAGHGLNLQKGGSVIVWFGLNWSLELYQQFNGRLHRQGQQNPVRIIHIVAYGCLDERVMSVLKDKDAVQGKLLDALKDV